VIFNGRPDGTHGINYDDGDRERGLGAAMIRSLEPELRSRKL
jgi:hypothetical protein